MASGQLLSEPVHEEERVVDGDADADERDDVRGVDGHIGYVGQPNRHADGGQHGSHADTDRKQGGDD